MDSDGYLSQLADIFNGITVNTPSISAIIAIVLAGVLLLASGFASASEIAFFSLTPSDRNDIDEQNHPSDEKISALLGDSERLLATILITNNFVNVTIIMLCNFFFMNVFVFHSPLAEFLILTVILTFLLLLFGEIMPKIYSAQKTLAFCRFSAPGIYFLEKLFRRSRIPVHTVLDLACGTGSMTWLLAGRGYELIAVDGSQEMLAAAREKNAPAEVPPLFLHQSMPRLDLYGTVDAAICCLDSLNYLTDPRDVQRTLRRLHLFISPGGLLTFDVRLPERLAALDGQVFLDETEDTYCVWRTEYRRGLCTYYMDLFTLAEDGSWDRSFELHRQRGYSVEQLTQWLEEAGFSEIRTWGDGKLRRPVPGEDRVYFTCIRK